MCFVSYHPILCYVICRKHSSVRVLILVKRKSERNVELATSWALRTPIVLLLVRQVPFKPSMPGLLQGLGAKACKTFPPEAFPNEPKHKQTDTPHTLRQIRRSGSNQWNASFSGPRAKSCLLRLHSQLIGRNFTEQDRRRAVNVAGNCLQRDMNADLHACRTISCFLSRTSKSTQCKPRNGGRQELPTWILCKQDLNKTIWWLL